jgi:predicted nucleic acid-binding protein
VKYINIPKAVFDEVVVKGKLKNYSEAFTIESFIKEEKIIVTNLNSFDESFYPPLGRGELESLELAKQKNELLLIDEKKGRNLAQILQIEHQTTIATIFELLISHNIDFSEYKSNLKNYAENSWVSADVIQEYIEKGEVYGR